MPAAHRPTPHAHDAWIRDLAAIRLEAQRRRWRNTLQAAGAAVALHDGQRRRTGEPYASHPAAVARLLRRAGVQDDATLACALLHDVLEDCRDRVTAPDLRTVYGLDARVVTLVTLLTRAPGLPDDAYYAQVARLPEAALVKGADRLHNLSTMAGVTPADRVARKLAQTQRYVLPLLRALSRSEGAPDWHRGPAAALESALLYEAAVARTWLCAQGLSGEPAEPAA